MDWVVICRKYIRYSTTVIYSDQSYIYIVLGEYDGLLSYLVNICRINIHILHGND